jgi:zinc protease
LVYNLGGDHDPKGRSGLAHLVEHLYVTAAAGKQPARSAEEYFRSFPSGCNAQTGDRYTVFATVFPKAQLDAELRDAAARMVDLRITSADLERERSRLLDEVANMFGRFPALGAMNQARELIRPTPHGGRKGGQPERVRTITLEEIQTHWKRFYKPGNAILVVAGPVDPAAVRRAVTERFGGLPPGERVPAAAAPGAAKFGTIREVSIRSALPQAGNEACLAFRAPGPGSELYAPFLVLVSRLLASASAKLDVGGGRMPVYFPALDDPEMLALTVAAKPGEGTKPVLARLEAIVADAVKPPLRPGEVASVRQMLGFPLGLGDIPDRFLAQNPYGVAFSLARREQLGIDPAKLDRALDAVTDQDLRRAATAVFSPDRHAGAVISVEK